MLGGRFSMLGRRVFRCSPEGDGCRRTWIDAGGPFTLLSFVVVRHLSLSAGSFSLFAGTHPTRSWSKVCRSSKSSFKALSWLQNTGYVRSWTQITSPGRRCLVRGC